MDGASEEEYEKMRLTLLQRIEDLNKINFELKSELSKITAELINLKLEKAQERARITGMKIYRM